METLAKGPFAYTEDTFKQLQEQLPACSGKSILIKGGLYSLAVKNLRSLFGRLAGRDHAVEAMEIFALAERVHHLVRDYAYIHARMPEDLSLRTKLLKLKLAVYILAKDSEGLNFNKSYRVGAKIIILQDVGLKSPKRKHVQFDEKQNTDILFDIGGAPANLLDLRVPLKRLNLQN